MKRRTRLAVALIAMHAMFIGTFFLIGGLPGAATAALTLIGGWILGGVVILVFDWVHRGED